MSGKKASIHYIIFKRCYQILSEQQKNNEIRLCFSFIKKEISFNFFLYIGNPQVMTTHSVTFRDIRLLNKGGFSIFLEVVAFTVSLQSCDCNTNNWLVLKTVSGFCGHTIAMYDLLCWLPSKSMGKSAGGSQVTPILASYSLPTCIL